MKIRNVLAFLMLAAMLLVIAACDDNGDDDSGVAPDPGFVAEAGDFANYDSWSRVDYAVAPANFNNLGGFAHAAGDTSIVRDIYSSNPAGFANGEWAEGTLVVKETHGFNGTTPDLANGNLLAMAKRGGDFDPDNGGWEYFMLDTDASIMNRSDDNPGDFTGCIGCHSQASMDYLFDHPSSYMMDFSANSEYIDFFENGFASWERVDSTFGTDPFLFGAHGDNTEYSRETFRWQPGAIYKDGIFPTGTVLAKRVSKRDNDGDIEYPDPADGAWTAMVKTDMDTWEWLMMNPVTGAVVQVGTSDDAVMCTTCHAHAGDDADGGDWVFLHEGLGN